MVSRGTLHGAVALELVGVVGETHEYLRKAREGKRIKKHTK